MKKKLLFLLVMVMMAIALLAITVNAEVVGSDSNAYGDVQVIEGMSEPSVLDKDARVVIVGADGKYYTFPSYYILADNSHFTWKQNKALNVALGYAESLAAQNIRNYVVRMEIPEGIVTSVEISSGATKFERAAALVEVSIPSTMELIGEYFFSECTKLTTVNGLENSAVTKILRRTFYKTSITQIGIPNDVTEIGIDAFRDCTSLTSVSLPISLVTLKDHAFASCTKLASVEIDPSTPLKVIEAYAFEKTALTSFYFPSTLESFLGEGGAFFQCYSLSKLENFGNTKITNVLYRTFHGCPLTSLELPSTLETIGNYGFSGHRIVQDKLTIPNSVIEIGLCGLAGGYSGSETGIGELVVSANITTLGNYAFEHLKVGKLSFYLSNNIKAIPEGAFNNWTDNFVIFYTGTKGELEALIANTNTKGNSKFLGAAIKSLEEYGNPETISGKTIVYGYDKCAAFYGGHQWSGKSNVIVGSYFDTIKIGDSCINCQTNDITSTINPIFVWKGYSKSTFGETYSVVQGFYIDRDALAQYKVYAPDFDFGIMATGNAKGEAINPQIGDEKVFTAIFDNTVNDYYDVKVTGITQALMDKNIVFCIYVLDGGKMYYLDGEKTADTVVGISYNNIV